MFILGVGFICGSHIFIIGPIEGSTNLMEGSPEGGGGGQCYLSNVGGASYIFGTKFSIKFIILGVILLTKIYIFGS